MGEWAATAQPKSGFVPGGYEREGARGREREKGRKEGGYFSFLMTKLMILARFR